ncbi:MAG TPA: glycosyltransferase [Thermoguttaceae bacterium]|nr:glycosyltransferase [Thermoguttaceae bacterium]
MICWLVVGYGLVGMVYWLWMLWAGRQTVRKVPHLSRLSVPEPPKRPTLSILIPACNEEETLGPAVRRLLEEDYPRLEIVLIDDRSTDRTGELVDRLAAQDRRIRPMHIHQLPDGWLGKVHALWQGFQQSQGEWVLLMDADVHLRPGTLRRIVAWAEMERLDFVAASPRILARGWLLRTAITAFLRMFCAMMRVWAVSNPRSSAFIGVGAFNLVRRSALERTEGFPWLRLEVADDLGLGLLMKRSGARCAFLLAPDWIQLEWYRNLREMARGVEKSYASVAQCSLLRAVVIWLLTAVLELAPVVAAGTWIVWAIHTGGGAAGTYMQNILCGALLGAEVGLMLVGCLGSIFLLHKTYREPIGPGLLFPLAVPLHGYFLLRAAWLGWRRGGVVWRGTLYPSALLRANQRVRAPNIFR